MKITKCLNQLSMILIMFIYLASCQSETESISIEGPMQDENFVSIEQARKISSHVLFTETDKQNVSGERVAGLAAKSKSRKVKNMLSVPDEDENPVYYIINFEENGFIILSADKRKEPILAFSEDNNFNFELEEYPAGLVDWLASNKDEIKELRKSRKSPDERTQKLWSNFIEKEYALIQNSIDSLSPNAREPYDLECKTYTTKYGPFLQTEWDQGCGFNDFLPLGAQIGCNFPTQNCGRAYAGCVPVAIAQIMKFHRSPSAYNWDLMPNDRFGSSHISALILSIHGMIPASQLNYKCDATGVKSHYDVADLFKSTLNYSSASEGDYNYSIVQNNLSLGRPVILKGGRNADWWIFNSYKDGHMWVCDGSTKYVDTCSESRLYLHMNWG
jgi:hypothetical protein